MNISHLFKSEKAGLPNCPECSGTGLILDEIVEKLKLNVGGECSHQFQNNNYPYGATMIYLLSESHLSVHTFVDEGKITLDLFTCDVSLEDRKIKKIICDYFSINMINVDMYYFTRG